MSDWLLANPWAVAAIAVGASAAVALFYAARYEKVGPRHSDHHGNPLLRYQALRSLDESPQLPAGYASMIVLALVPPLWRRVMDKRVAAHYGGDLSLANVQHRAAANESPGHGPR